MVAAGSQATLVAQAAASRTSAWYRALVAAFDLDPASFQVVQGAMALGSASSDVWAFFDAVPPRSLNAYYSPSGFNSFAITYGAVINNLVPSGTGGDPIAAALDLWLAAGNGARGYTVSASTLRAALAAAGGATVSYDPAATLKAAAWAGFSVPPSALAAKGGAALPPAGAARVTYAHVVTIAAQPLGVPKPADPSLGAFPAWFERAALRLAFTGRYAGVWKPAEPSWDTTFGAAGNLQRYCAALLVADGATVTFASPTLATFALKTTAPETTADPLTAALYPFLPPLELLRGGPSLLSKSGTTLQTPTGAPFVLGVTVAPISSLFH